jgi:tetratricopeptide (TPR) repeat protein
MRRPLIALFLSILAPILFAASPRITFERVVPAPHDIGDAEEIAVVQAIGDSPKIETFVEIFVHQINRSGMLRARDARGSTGPADVYLDVKAFTCSTTTREGEGSARDIDRNRVRRRHVWADAICTARIDVLSPAMKRLSSFQVKGEGTSPRGDVVGSDEREIALEQAARYAAISAAERITPRRVRESIPLDETAPAFAEAMLLIEAERLADARAMWETTLKKQPRSAALHFNLGALCEALGDRRAAEQHYSAARKLAPDRYTRKVQ